MRQFTSSINLSYQGSVIRLWKHHNHNQHNALLEKYLISNIRLAVDMDIVVLVISMDIVDIHGYRRYQWIL